MIYSPLRNDKLYISYLRLEANNNLKNEADKYDCSLHEILEEKEQTIEEYIKDYIDDHFKWGVEYGL